MRRGIALVAAVAIVVLVNFSIYEKEQHLAHGEIMYLELAPVDPRSLMQGDYMTLRFEIGNQIRDAVGSNGPADSEREEISEGYAVVRLDERGVAHFVRLAASNTALEDNQRALFFRQRNGRILFATNAFFFQEGQAERYEAARYGRFRVNEEGEPLLVGLHDEGLVRLDPLDG